MKCNLAINVLLIYHWRSQSACRVAFQNVVAVYKQVVLEALWCLGLYYLPLLPTACNLKKITEIRILTQRNRNLEI